MVVIPQPIGVNLITIVLKRVAQDHSKEYKDHCQQSKILYWIPFEYHGPSISSSKYNYGSYYTNTCDNEDEQDICDLHDQTTFYFRFCHISISLIVIVKVVHVFLYGFVHSDATYCLDPEQEQEEQEVDRK